jgi:hypothetical protein
MHAQIIEVGPPLSDPIDAQALHGRAPDPDEGPFLLGHAHAEGLVGSGAGKKIGGPIEDKLDRSPHDALPIELDEGLIVLFSGIPDDDVRSQRTLYSLLSRRLTTRREPYRPFLITR